jgi:hypothetical protein
MHLITIPQLNTFLLTLAHPSLGPLSILPGEYTITTPYRTGTFQWELLSHTEVSIHIRFNHSRNTIDFLTIMNSEEIDRLSRMKGIHPFILEGLKEGIYSDHFLADRGCEGSVTAGREELSGKGDEWPVMLVARGEMVLEVYRYESKVKVYRVLVSGIRELPLLLRG